MPDAHVETAKDRSTRAPEVVIGDAVQEATCALFVTPVRHHTSVHRYNGKSRNAL